MSSPEDVLRRPIATPVARHQNVPLDITPNAVEAFEHHEGYSFATAKRGRWLSLWGFPWWTADRATGYGSGAFGAGPYGEAVNQGDYGALRYGRGAYGTGGTL